jgi:hypothetical protein
MMKLDEYMCRKCNMMSPQGYFYKNGSFICEQCIRKEYWEMHK